MQRPFRKTRISEVSRLISYVELGIRYLAVVADCCLSTEATPQLMRNSTR